MTLPLPVQQLIEHYQALRLGNKLVKTPYFRFYRNNRKIASLPALSGKGLPQEIEILASEYAKNENFDFNEHSTLEIRNFLISHSLGIDCSGFVMRLLDAWLQAAGKERFWKYVSKPRGLIRRFKFKIRPENNISAEMLTGEPGSKRITQVTEIRMGDLIRSRSGKHILFVTGVKNGLIHYIHATRHYGDDNGIIEGIIKITTPGEDLATQEWLPEHGDDNQAFKGYKTHPEENGVWRLKALANS